MPGARDESEELRRRQNKIERLWNKEEQKGLRKVAQDASNCERHASEITERVAREDFGREPMAHELAATRLTPQRTCCGTRHLHTLPREEA